MPYPIESLQRQAELLESSIQKPAEFPDPSNPEPAETQLFLTSPYV